MDMAVIVVVVVMVTTVDMAIEAVTELDMEYAAATFHLLTTLLPLLIVTAHQLVFTDMVAHPAMEQDTDMEHLVLA
jgi:hypothetical protein